MAIVDSSKKMFIDFIKTSEIQMYDEFRELKAFSGGFLIATVGCIMIFMGCLYD